MENQPEPELELDLIFIPYPVMGHIAQMVEFAKLIINRSERLSITILVMKLPIESIDPVGNTYIDALGRDNHLERIRFIHLPPLTPASEWNYTTSGFLLDQVVANHRSHVTDIVGQLIGQGQSKMPPVRVVAFFVDMFCTAMIDVAKEFGIPSYVFFTCGAAMLELMLHLQNLHDEHGQDVSELKRSSTEFITSSFANPVPTSVLPFVLVDKNFWSNRFLHYSRGYIKAKGIVVNTFSELESHAVSSFDGKTPPIYPVGPILNRTQTSEMQRRHHDDIVQWLDDQPPSSVVFLCFGTRGGFDRDQVVEIANGVERSGCRFLWALREPPQKGKIDFPTEYTNSKEVLPEGFLERTAQIGKVTGWAPQIAVLAHKAVGGFVSHCGWNSILESIWCGVPFATWPIYAEQQLNAFQLVRELELAVEISLDYHRDDPDHRVIVTAEDIERGIRRVMDGDSNVRKKVREMGEKSRMTVTEGGSSYTSLGRLIDELMDTNL